MPSDREEEGRGDAEGTACTITEGWPSSMSPQSHGLLTLLEIKLTRYASTPAWGTPVTSQGQARGLQESRGCLPPGVRCASVRHREGPASRRSTTSPTVPYGLESKSIPFSTTKNTPKQIPNKKKKIAAISHLRSRRPSYPRLLFLVGRSVDRLRCPGSRATAE